MTQDEIIRMAREAGIIFEPMTIDGIEYEYRYVRCSDSIGEDEADCIERFAALVVAHEREKQAEQEPVGVVEGSGEWGIAGVLDAGIPIGTKLYAAPVRTKDLTDDEIYDVCKDIPFVVIGPDYDLAIARAVIAADREKNK